MDLVLQLAATGLVVGSLYALCALGWGLIYGTTLHFHVAHGAVFTLAAYVAYVGQQRLHLPLVAACALGVVGAALAGLLIDLCIYQRLEARGAVRTTVFIASLGLLIVVIGGMGTIYGSAIGAVLFLVAQSYLQDLLRLGSEAAAGLPWLSALLSPDRWLLWLGVLFVLSVYYFPTGVVGRLRAAAARKAG